MRVRFGREDRAIGPKSRGVRGVRPRPGHTPVPERHEQYLYLCMSELRVTPQMGVWEGD